MLNITDNFLFGKFLYRPSPFVLLISERCLIPFLTKSGPFLGFLLVDKNDKNSRYYFQTLFIVLDYSERSSSQSLLISEPPLLRGGSY